MAGEWIKVEAATADKPEVLRIARILKIDHDAVFGKLVRLWSWIDTNSVDGVVDGVVDADIDRLCHCDGFTAACVSVGWLAYDSQAERVSLPNFERHNGETAKKRALKNRRQAKWREGVDDNVDTKASTGASTREEKRREEEKQERAPAKKAKASRLADWIGALDGADAVPAADPLFAWAKTAGIPAEWIGLAWWAFENRYGADGKDAAKTYADWRAVFRSAVKEDWLRLWRKGRDGWELTTAGENVRCEMEAAS